MDMLVELKVLVFILIALVNGNKEEVVEKLPRPSVIRGRTTTHSKRQSPSKIKARGYQKCIFLLKSIKGGTHKSKSILDELGHS